MFNATSLLNIIVAIFTFILKIVGVISLNMMQSTSSKCSGSKLKQLVALLRNKLRFIRRLKIPLISFVFNCIIYFKVHKLIKRDTPI